MADLIKKIKIKKQDGTFTDYIPIGAEAQNISTIDGESVQLKLNKKPYYYNSVADMKADTKLKAGDMAVTLGYYEVNDGGGAEYKIVNTASQTEYQEELENNLYATLVIKNNILNVKQLGAKGNDSFDNTQIFTSALSSNYKTIIIPTGTYRTGVISFNNKNLKGENDTSLKCNTSCTDWITFGNKSMVENIIFNGNNLADTVKIATTDASANLFNIKNCMFWFMNKSGLTSNGIDAIISGCVFRNNKQNGLRINQVGNIVENCYSYLNELNGIFIGVGTNITSNCKVYKNKTWGYYIDNSNANAHYITIDNCESQENGAGSVYLSAGTRNCIINDLSSLGESDITTGGIDGRAPVIHNEGSYNKITAVVTPFHIYEPNEWYAYPTSLLFIGDGINNDIKITNKVISSEYEQLKTLYPSLTYQELTFNNNIGQSNKVIINNVDVQNKISVLNSDNTYASVRGEILGNKSDNCVFVATPSFVNSLATETIYTFGLYETSLDDDLTILPYQSGIVYPLNYKDYFKACVRIDIVGTVNGQEVVRTGVDHNTIITNTNENLYKSYVMPYVQYITSQTGYEAGSLKIITRIMCQKTSAITITEPLYLACKNICLLNDLQ